MLSATLNRNGAPLCAFPENTVETISLGICHAQTFAARTGEGASETTARAPAKARSDRARTLAIVPQRAPIGCDFRFRTGPSGPGGVQSAQPTEPSISILIRRLSSTAYSIGSSLTKKSKKPLTIIAVASASVSPRLIA